MTAMDWNDVRYFLALARTGSVRAAGSKLGVSHSTVARRVEALEERLAARLFDRSRDGFALTEAGTRMLARAECVETEMASLERDIVGQDERLAGSVSLTCCDEFVSAMLLEDMRKFCGSYPDIELAIITDTRPFDLSKREADIAVRVKAINDEPAGHLLGRKVVPLVMASYVAVAHEERCDPEIVGNDTRWIAFEERRQVELLIAASSYPDVPAWGAMSSLSVLVQSARSGHGIVMLPCYVGDAEPELRRLAQPDLRHVADLWVLSHPDLRDNARLMATRQCVYDALKARDPLFRGDTPRTTRAPERSEIATSEGVRT